MRPYDPTRTSLYFPESGETVFRKGVYPGEILLAIEFCRLAYLRVAEKPKDAKRLNSALATVGFNAPHTFHDKQSGAFGFGTYREKDNTAFLVFRGMQPDDLSDLAPVLSVAPVAWHPGAGCVHSGFANSYASLHEKLLHWMQTLPHHQLTICGHRLGGAIASLAAVVHRPNKLVTIACPKVGDANFCRAASATPTVRIVNCCDIVPTLPPGSLFGYQHIGESTYIASDGSVYDSPALQMIEQDQQGARAQYFLTQSWKPGSVLFRDFADHSPANYVRAFFKGASS